MKNYESPGNFVTLTAPSGGVITGICYQIGQIVVVATVTVAQTLPFVAMVAGIVSAAKVGSQAWTEGAIIYWDDTNKYFTTTATSNLRAGCAVEAVGSGAGETTGVVRLNGSARPDGV